MSIAGLRRAPWHVGTGNKRLRLIVYDADGYAVADTAVHHRLGTGAQMEATARAIAALPDLIAAVRFHIEALTTYMRAAGCSTAAIDAATADARTALAKATGAEG